MNLDIDMPEIGVVKEYLSDSKSLTYKKEVDSLNKLITELKNQTISLKQEKNDQLKQLKEDYEARELLLREEIKELNKNNNNNNNNNKSSYETGLIGEKKLLDLLREDNEFTVKDTHGTSHMGDAEILYNDFKNENTFKKIKKDNLVWSLEGPNQEVLIGNYVKTEFLNVKLITLLSLQKTHVFEFDNNTSYLSLDDNINVNINNNNQEYKLNKKDGLYIPANNKFILENKNDFNVEIILCEGL